MKSLIILTMSMVLATPLFAQNEAANDREIERDITEGKIQAAESLWLRDMEKGIDLKQQKAAALIVLVANRAQERVSIGDDNVREEAEYAHVGFVARLQGIHEDREALARKEIQPDYATLQNYSKRLDALISDLQAFLK
ncbi:hypothetical protein DOM21_05680 [Bacteriovorax stolpii]|uniref:Uncharacterized protein n=1 Tax=Bacteriovorax stolpii TaxID=960 RepID=A0A2K9NU59_BACTC|nr:hypothetical protein [Bacteriovorax stolpii]AUN99053.1 hypothetical protein C0V70_13260 [Bacteriovorax stolpii]QDK40953.1 hypothetical protein DOM21_05680 [Bacteriovorax stolpii]TDP55420.1 hypothetical protein C8D79_0469 [Bacteriovorax stolpii]